VADLSRVESIDDVPGLVTAAEWRSLEERLEWSASRGAFLLHPTWHLYRSALPGGTRGREEVVPVPSSSLRPKTFAEIIGQQRVVRNLVLAVRAALDRGEALGHVLLSGQPGLGKTTLAGAIAREMGGRLHAAMGALITEPSQVIGLLTRLGRSDVLFIDEIHQLPAPATECLHSAMEDRLVHVLLAERGKVRALRVELEPFTLAGATMEPGALPEAFRARFTLRERLDPYCEADLARLTGVAAAALGLEASARACVAIACRGRGTPREALRLLDRSRDVAQAAGSPAIEEEHVEEAASRLEIDPDGLQAEERHILEILIARGRAMGLGALSATLGMDRTTLSNIHEPYLLSRGYIVRTARGREATAEARLRMARGMSKGNPRGRWIRICGRIRA
jgi:Holliday junction DNA helicase RuvB